MSEVSSIKITELIYAIINKVSLTGDISGKIYKQASPVNDVLENVVIITNPQNGKHRTGVQLGISNINIVVQANGDGTPNSSRIDEIVELVRALLVNNSHPANGYYFNILREGLFNDYAQNKTYYYNLTLTNQKQ